MAVRNPCIKNLTLRHLLARVRHSPWRYIGFLHYAVDCIIMTRNGGSFDFIHRMLKEHLATQAPSFQKYGEKLETGPEDGETSETISSDAQTVEDVPTN